MHYPILLETELANRWKLSVKTLRTWRQRNVGPRWYTLGRHVRYHVADVLAYEVNALPQWLAGARGSRTASEKYRQTWQICRSR